jgi:MOSC domain-containing protein YiiM
MNKSQHQELKGIVRAVAQDGEHRFSKSPTSSIAIVAGLGVAGDAHAGETVQHRSRVAVDPSQPNLRQVHLIHSELLDQLALEGFAVEPGQLGENITTSGIALLDLPRGTLLRIGASAVLQVTGLRNPCKQIEAFCPGLLARLARKQADGNIERLAGIMCIVVEGGRAERGDTIIAALPAEPHVPLAPV